jgi:ribosomal protein L11 methyltransferase
MNRIEHPDGPPKQWVCIELTCAADQAEDLAAVVAEAFTIGVEITPYGIRFYFDSTQCSQAWEADLQQLLEQFSEAFAPSQPLTYSSHLIFDEGWAERWKEHFKPLRVGSRFIVCPTWEEPQPRTQDWVVRIDPGRAFGTGHHETTRLCLEWLDRCSSDQAHLQQSLLDVGSGTGILAIGAALAGWRWVVALDIDPEALEITAENIHLNRVAQSVRIFSGTAAEVREHFAVVLANIQAGPLIELAPVLIERLQPGGRLVLSGILTEQQDMVTTAYENHGMRLTSQYSAGEWCLLELAHGLVGMGHESVERV